MFPTHLGIGHPWVGNSAKGYQLGQEDSKTPYIRFDGKSKIIEVSPAGKFSHYKSCFLPGVVGSLWRCPLYREPRTHPRLVLVLLDQPRQPEVCNLDVVVVPHQTVPADQKYFRSEIVKSSHVSGFGIPGILSLILKSFWIHHRQLN